MEIITILLASDDMHYAKTFAKCVAEENKSILFTIISGKDFYTYSKINEFSLVLIDNEINSIEKEYITLVETREDCNSKQFNCNTLYKYDTAENISKQLAIIYCMKTGCKMLHPINKNSKTILFCSAAGGTGKTSIALGLAQELVRFHGKSVLYINYEEIESTDRYFITDSEKSISNYLYYIETSKNLDGLIDMFTVCDEYGVRTFSASKGRNQLKLLNIEELARLLEIIQIYGKFEYILIDSDNNLREENLWLISVCDKICKVEKWNNNIKQDNYKKYLSHKLGNQIFDKIINVINFFQRKEEDVIQYEKDTINNTIYIEYDKNSFYHMEIEENKTFTKINIDKDFGVGIRQLSTNLTLILQ